MKLHAMFPVLFYKAGKKRQIFRTRRYVDNPVKWTKKTYYKRFHFHLNLENPQTFYEKMNYWKHFSYVEQQDPLTDKLSVKKILSDLGYERLCSKTLFSCENVDELKKWISLNKTRISQFVIKTSHSCGDVFIYNNKKILKKGGIEIKHFNKVYKMLKAGLKFNHYYSCFEQNYRHLKPQIFVEDFFDYDDAVEYEFMCNYGKVRFTKVVKNRQSDKRIEVLADENFNVIFVERNRAKCVIPNNLNHPKQIDFITEFITKTVSNFPFCRVDFIEKDNLLHFSEFTFVKAGGMDSFPTKELDFQLGQLFKL